MPLSDTRTQRSLRRRLALEPLEPRHLLAASVIISEFMASNDNTIDDGDGISSDWIELHNLTDSAIDLANWHLTDNASNLDKWTFPVASQSVLPAGGYLIVFASGQPTETYLDPDGYWHTDFRLAAGGEYLALTDPNETVVFEFAPQYPPQLTDVSYGFSLESATLVGPANTTAALVPTNGSLDSGPAGPAWSLPGFDASAWSTSAGGVGVGFEKIDPDGGPGNPPIPHDGLTLNGPLGHDLTDANEDGTLDVLIDAGGAAGSPPTETPPRALDGTSSTKWLSFAPTGTYYEIQFLGGAANVVNGYTLTSANDSPGRDPYSWTLLASNDGVNFSAIDSRSAQDFTSRFHTKYYEFSNTTAFEYYRFDFQTEFGVTGNNQPVAIQIAEIELLDSADVSGNGGPVTGLIGNDLTDVNEDGVYDVSIEAGDSSNSPSGEEPDRALDGTNQTKWLAFAPGGTFYEMHFLDGLPRIVDQYTITSANDADRRDPYSWTLSGSNDGLSYSVVDTQTAEDFANRFETHFYEFNNVTPYAHYRFDFQTEFGVTGANPADAFQLAEIELLSSLQYNYQPLIDLDVQSDWDAEQSSVYQRVEFQVNDPTALSTLTLNMQYDDGFVAYLNGVQVASANTPAIPDWQSSATATRDTTDAVVPETFNLSSHTDLLNVGTNVLAIHVLNANDESLAVLSVPSLTATVLDSAFTHSLYYETPTPGTVNGEGRLGFVGEPTFSIGRGFYDTPFSLSIKSSTADAQLYYTTNGADPTPANGTEVTGTIAISGTTVVKAAAFKADHYDSAASTHTYVFVKDVVRQDFQATLNAGFPTNWGSFTPDYGMDSDVIGNFDINGNSIGGDNYNGRFANTIQNDLVAIPTLSLSLPIDDLFGANGIYSHPTSEGVNWEKATSVELIYPDGTPGFQIDAGIRMQGGAFRMDSLSKKHSFRLFFKGIYGATKLDFPFFGTDAVDSFDTITLRMESNDGYAWAAAGGDAQYARNSFSNRSAAALGQISPHDNRVQLYLNGIYWGLYNPNERPDASFSASYYGGNKDEWDAYNDGKTIDGTSASWSSFVSLARDVANANTAAAELAAYQKIQGNNPDGTNNPAYETYLDVDNYIDYLLVNFYTGNADWPHRNWYASRRRGPESTGFKFHIWDAETALNLGSGPNTNRTGANVEAAEPYDDLRTNDDFKLQFADRAHRALFHHGALTPAESIARYQEILAEVFPALNAESARWGDMHRPTPYTSIDWANEANSVIDTFLTPRTVTFLGQLRTAGLYPTIDAPVFNQHGGNVESGFQVTVTSTAGLIYYTTDGSDPRGADGTSAGTQYQGGFPISELTSVRSRTLSNGTWSAMNEAVFELLPPTGDFDDDGNFDCTDIDALVSEIVSGNDTASFDMTGDGQLDKSDVDAWLAVAGADNSPTGDAYKMGDINLDGNVNDVDFGIWNTHRFTNQPAWCSGDLNADGFVDISDFNAWNNNHDHGVAATSKAIVANHPQQNLVDAADVDADGQVTPMDALLILNVLEAHTNEDKTDGTYDVTNVAFVDVNGDGETTPLDALLVINRLNNAVPARDETASFAEKDEETALGPPWISLIDNHWEEEERS